MKFTGERFINDLNLGLEIETEHYHRYESILNLVKDKVVLDAACGAGYGSFILSHAALQVYGLDIDQEAIDYASSKFKSKSSIDFIHGSIATIPLPDSSIDVIVSFETIEHVNETLQAQFLTEVKRVLKDDGLLIISTPNKYIYSDLRDYNNEFHIKEFYKDEFECFLKQYFHYVKLYKQGFHLTSVITSDNLDDLAVIANEKNSDPRYFVALCSNKEELFDASIDSIKLNLQDYYIKNNLGLYTFINEKLKARKQTLYYDLGSGFNERDILAPQVFELEDRKFRTMFALPADCVKKLRWDPEEGVLTGLWIKSIVYRTSLGNKGTYNIEHVITNGLRREEGIYYFFNTDPFILLENLPNNVSSIEFIGEYVDLNDANIEEYVLHANLEVAQSKKELEFLQVLSSQKEEALSSLKQSYEKQINELSHQIEQKTSEIYDLNQQVLENKQNLHKLLLEKDDMTKANLELNNNNFALMQKNDELKNYNDYLIQEVTVQKNTLEQVYQSNSWRLTKPLRTVGRLSRNMPKKMLKKIVRQTYKVLPLPNDKKIKLKNWVYNTFEPAISGSEMYKVWAASNYVARENNRANTSFFEDEVSKAFIDQIYDIPSKHSPDYIPISKNQYEFSTEDTKLIAMYLPQFHPFPENDEWWGKGFTEWTNVSKAVPQFVGHYQPHLPGELGYYDLRLVENMERQVELAKQYGIFGFCFYHYWFDGKRLMEKPVDTFIQNQHIDMPFCLCWANENWTRRWDGEENDILIQQNYSKEDDKAFIADLVKYISDKRYIRVNGKPIIIIYRPSLLPNFKESAAIWREHCREVGIGEIHLVGVSWGIKNPEDYDLDALMEFPPHCIHEYGNELINDQVQILNPEFQGLVYNYKKFVEDEKYLFDTSYLLYKSVSPSWDNTARKPNNGTVYHYSSPRLYKKWLKNVIYHTKRVNTNEHNIVFVNAWNEWAEGAHLEPDRRYGYAFLEATRSALLETRKENLKKIIYVTHDANLNGAQLLSLHIIKTLKLGFHYEIEILCISGGPLVEEYEKYGIVSVLTNETEESILKIIQNLKSQGYEKAICNTVISGGLVKLLSDSRIDVISLIHELPGVIKQYSAQKKASFIAQYADKVIFPSNYVYEKFLSITDINEQKCVIQPQGLYKKNDYKAHIKLAREEIRSALNLSPDVKIVLGVGYADHRKGIDLFAEAAAITRSMNQKIVFVWVGNRDIHYLSELKEEHLNNVVFVNQTSEIGKYYAAADIYLLTSREDPFPSVVLEAFDVSIPVIGFKDAGGFVDIISEKTGQLVEHSNVQELVRVLNDLLKDDPLRLELGREARCLVEQNFDFSKYVYKLLELLGHEYKKVSVVLPNYNYSKYLKERLDSICSQRYPIYELIILDDCSTDQSVNVIKKYLETNVLDSKMKISFVVNETNSGSVFKQWAKGINMAQGDYIWIAEADDLCSNQFLDGAMKGFHLDPSVVLSYTQSRQIDENGNTLAENYLDYTKEIDAEKWAGDYLDTGENEIKYRLYVKNTIPNVSAVVFKKYPINEILEDLQSFKIAGDWLFYIWLLKKGKMYFNHQSLNDHRRHTASVTKSENQQRHYDEVVKMQDYIIEQFGITPERKIKINDYRKFLKEYLLLN